MGDSGLPGEKTKGLLRRESGARSFEGFLPQQRETSARKADVIFPTQFTPLPVRAHLEATFSRARRSLGFSGPKFFDVFNTLL